MACHAQPASQAGGKMRTGRLEAFSDGVIAIIITIMVLEMKVPHGDTVNDLLTVLPIFLSYVLSFVYVGIYWNNHHHLLHATTIVTGAILLGEPAPVVLAVAVSVCYRLDGGESFQRTTHRTLRRRATDGRRRVLPASAGDHPLAGTGLDFEKGGWPGLEGQALACAVYSCDCCHLACRGSPRVFS